MSCKERFGLDGYHAPQDVDVLGRYYSDLCKLIGELDMGQVRDVLGVLRFAFENEKTVYVVGNGGSASTAEHYENDFTKIAGLKSFALTNTSVVTALGNDNGYDNIFVDKLKTVMNPGDVVIGISGSGNSMNVVKALEYARDNRGVPVGILGFKGGEILKRLSDESLGGFDDFPHVLVRSEDYGYIEDIHLTLGHSLARNIQSKVGLDDLVE
jgi:D-sedoheptulose 7-phosphate isomerase